MNFLPLPVPPMSDKRKGRGHGYRQRQNRRHAATRVRRPAAGGGVRIGFEGGQMPLARRIPKRGFNNIFAETPAMR